MCDEQLGLRVAPVGHPPTMPTEIADSDGESELDSPAQPKQLLPKHPLRNRQTVATNNISEVAFSDFPSREQESHKTQHLQLAKVQQEPISGGTEHEGVVSHVVDDPARDERLSEPIVAALQYRAFQPEPAAMKLTPTSGKKRRHTMQGDGEEVSGSDQMSQKRQRKSRVKTYENNSGRMQSSHTQASSDALEDLLQTGQRDSGSRDNGGLSSSVPATADSSIVLNPAISMEPPLTASSHDIEEEVESARQRSSCRRVCSLIEESISDTSREISTSRSSMGNYESINIDFRGHASGLEVGANPFGSLSQTSIEDEVNDSDQEKAASKPSSNRVKTSALLDTSAYVPRGANHDLVSWIGHQAADNHEPCQTQGRSRSIDPVHSYNNPSSDVQLLSILNSSSRKSGKSKTRHSMSPAMHNEVASMNRSISDSGGVSAQASMKKRGRKPIGQHLLSQAPGPAPEEEPALNSEAAIVLPKEQYKPSPSQLRRVTSETHATPASPEPAPREETRNTDEQSSPVKQPTSELNLSDEAFVGLPKENYRPRPSRSRSKRVIVEDDDAERPESLPIADQAPTPSAVLFAEADSVSAKKSKKPKKAPKKTKVKRAKTSAGALLKKSEPMLSEGEEDVLWLETKPSLVKLDPPPEVKRETAARGEDPELASVNSSIVKAAGENENTELKNQEEERCEPQTGAANTPSTSVGTRYSYGIETDNSHILVDIPPLSMSHTQVEPKKRGRKKKLPEAPAFESVDLEEPSHGSETSDVDANGFPEDGDVNTPPAKPEPKRRGRKKKVADVPAELEKFNENAERIPCASSSGGNVNGSSRPALVDRDLNRTVSTANLKTPIHTSSDLASETPSYEKENRLDPASSHLETPHKQVSVDLDSVKGPTKHSPINPAGGRASYRVGLSKRAAIPPLLSIVRKDIDRSKEKDRPKKKPTNLVPVEDEE